MKKTSIIKLKKNIKYSICSCGLSKKMPYCDNAHRDYNKINNTNYKSVKVCLLNDEKVKELYLGISKKGRKNFRDVLKEESLTKRSN